MKSKKYGKFGCLLQIVIMILSSIAFSYLMSPHDIVQAAAKPANNVCCEKTKSGAWCQTAPASQCAAGFQQTPTSCEATSFCRMGCCYDSNEGTCMENTPQKVCQENQGVWQESADCSIPQCELGCCVLGIQAAFVSLTRCKKLSAFYNLGTDFKKNIPDELTCISLASLSDQGACVYEVDYAKNCKFTTRQECNKIAGTVNASVTSNATFHKDYLCSSPELGTVCGPTQQTACIDGKDEVYFVDTCGNPANIYDSSKIDDKAYWNKVVKKEASCGFGNTNGNANSGTCGSCDYFYSSTCKKAERGTSVAYGNNICKNLGCKTADGKTRTNGESWCYIDKPSGKTDSVGSRYFRHICINGAEIVEPCAEFRQEVCLETATGGFSQAACVVNRWQDCILQTEKLDCDNTDKRDCQWTSETDSVAENKTIACIPKNSPGLEFWNDDAAQQTCAMGNARCVVTEEKSVYTGFDWEAKDSECLHEDGNIKQSWVDTQNQKCSAIGDCGVKINWIGKTGYKTGYNVSITSALIAPLVSVVKSLSFLALVSLGGEKGIVSGEVITEDVNLESGQTQKIVFDTTTKKITWGDVSYSPGESSYLDILNTTYNTATKVNLKSPIYNQINELKSRSSKQPPAQQQPPATTPVPAPASPKGVQGTSAIGAKAATQRTTVEYQGIDYSYQAASSTWYDLVGGKEVADKNVIAELNKLKITQPPATQGSGVTPAAAPAASISPSASGWTSLHYNLGTNKIPVRYNPGTKIYEIESSPGNWVEARQTATGGWEEKTLNAKDYTPTTEDSIGGVKTSDLSAAAVGAAGEKTWASTLGTAAGHALLAFGAVQLIGNIVAPDETAWVNSISYGAAAGYFAADIFKAQTSMTASQAAWAGIGIGVLVTLLTYEDERTKVVTFECQPYQPKTGGADCEKCNTDKYPCTEYRCKSLGQSCQIINPGTSEEKCAWINPRDITSPEIKPSTSVLTNGYKYADVKARPPGPGFKIQKTAGGCIKAFTPITFGVETNEPTSCKIASNHTASFENMTYYMDGSNTLKYNHSQMLSLPGPANINNQGPIVTNDGQYTWFIRCQDANGNSNAEEYAVRFCIEPGPDVTAPVIVSTSIFNGMPVKYGINQTPLEIYVNEPAECKWSTLDQSYDIMEHNFTCSTTVEQMNAEMLYTCTTTLTGLKNNADNNYYIRCKDQPRGVAEKDRNINSQSYNLKLKGTVPLNIVRVAPNATTISGSTSVVPVSLEVDTDNGYSYGDANCYFSASGLEKSYVKMFETGTNKHTQRQDLPAGSYKYYFKCVDLGGNTDYNQVSFKVFVDQAAPAVARAYNYEGKLMIKTDEISDCSYNTNPEIACNFKIDEGTSMPYSNSTEHATEWIVGKTFYIKCRDSSGNEPMPNACSIVVKTIK